MIKSNNQLKSSISESIFVKNYFWTPLGKNFCIQFYIPDGLFRGMLRLYTIVSIGEVVVTN